MHAKPELPTLPEPELSILLRHYGHKLSSFQRTVYNGKTLGATAASIGSRNAVLTRRSRNQTGVSGPILSEEPPNQHGYWPRGRCPKFSAGGMRNLIASILSAPGVGQGDGGHQENPQCALHAPHPAIPRMSIRYICRPPACAESMHTKFPSGLNRGCVSQRHSPVYSLGEWKWPSQTRRLVATS